MTDATTGHYVLREHFKKDDIRYPSLLGTLKQTKFPWPPPPPLAVVINFLWKVIYSLYYYNIIYFVLVKEFLFKYSIFEKSIDYRLLCGKKFLLFGRASIKKDFFETSITLLSSFIFLSFPMVKKLNFLRKTFFFGKILYKRFKLCVLGSSGDFNLNFFFQSSKSFKYLPHLQSNHHNYFSESSNGKYLHVL